MNNILKYESLPLGVAGNCYTSRVWKGEKNQLDSSFASGNSKTIGKILPSKKFWKNAEKLGGFMKKFATIFLGVLLMVTLFTGCSEKDTTGPNIEEPTAPTLAENFDIEFTIPADFIDFNSVEVDYEGQPIQGYQLDQFVPKADVNTFVEEEGFDTRSLFAIEIVSNDEDGNWTPRNKGMGDLTWAQFKAGYLLPEQSGKAFFTDDQIPNSFNVKQAHYLRLYRKIDIALNGVTTTFETGTFETEEITYTKKGETYTEAGFPLSNLISDYVTNNQEDFSFKMTAADNWENDDTNNLFSWEDIECGYWLTEKNRAIFVNEDGSLKWKSVKFVEKIELAEQ